MGDYDGRASIYRTTKTIREQKCGYILVREVESKMALITCPDCKREISDQATACPNCGRPIAHKPPLQVKDVNAHGFLGKPGTAFHAANVGCLTMILGVVAIAVVGFLVASLLR